MRNTATWVDTGFLVALFAKNDTHHASAIEFLKNAAKPLELHGLWPVVVEACFFLNPQSKQNLLEWLESGAVIMHDIRQTDLPLIRNILNKYQNIEPDFTDAALVAFADLHQIHNILTVDKRDFSIYRLSTGHSFNRLWL